ncbi:MAG: hypothetical protein ACOH13_07440 [Flavobacteriales bacterium]
MRKATLLLVLLAAPISALRAQNTAFRYIVGEMHRVYDQPVFGNYCMGLGLDRSFNNRLTVGFDVAYDIGGVLRASGKEVVVSSGGVTANYLLTPKLLSLNYHTEYALADDQATHVYLGTFIGLRHVSQSWVNDGYNYNPSGATVAFPGMATGSKWLVPLGLRSGIRGPVDEGFFDLYVQLGYQVGGGEDLYVRYPALLKAEYTQTSSLAISIGLAYGFGW